MDGNRRYAEREHVDKATGHTHGYGKMVEVIHWCIELGVRHVTVYAFSIDNFKRSPAEVEALMHLAEAKYKELAQDNGLAEREGIEMHVVGDLDLPPPAVQGAAARLMANTERLPVKRATLNVCFSYTASEEVVSAVDALQAAVREGQLLPADVTPAALHGSLRTRAATPPVDLLLRTSGETRLSDFMLWQAAPHAQLCYLDTLWPDLGFLDFARCVLSYQRHGAHLREVRERVEARLAQAAGVQEGAGDGPERGEGAGLRGVGCGGEAGQDVGGSGGVRAEARDAAAGEGSDGEAGAERRAGAGRHVSSSCEAGGQGAGGACSSGRGHAGWRLLESVARASLGRLGLWGPVGNRGGGQGKSAFGVPGELRLLRYLEGLERRRKEWVAAHVHL